MSKDELFDIEYDNLNYYSEITRNLHYDIMKNKLYEEKTMYIQTNVLLDVIKYTVALEEKVRDLKADIVKLESEIDK